MAKEEREKRARLKLAEAENLAATMVAIMTRPVPDLAKRRPDLPVALVTLIHHMLEKKPEHRYASMAAVASLMRRAKIWLVRAASRPPFIKTALPDLRHRPSGRGAPAA